MSGAHKSSSSSPCRRQPQAAHVRPDRASSTPIRCPSISSSSRRGERTGWNVIASTLIDATATRDVTAWQQLRGRAIARGVHGQRLLPAIMALIGSQIRDDGAGGDARRRRRGCWRRWHGSRASTLDDRLWALLETVAPAGLVARARANGLAALAADERKAVAVALMRRYNKVTHIFELVKATVRPRRWVRPTGASGSAAGHRRQARARNLGQSLRRREAHRRRPCAAGLRPGPAPTSRALREHLRQAIDGVDDVIVSGWMQVSMP